MAAPSNCTSAISMEYKFNGEHFLWLVFDAMYNKSWNPSSVFQHSNRFSNTRWIFSSKSIISVEFFFLCCSSCGKQKVKLESADSQHAFRYMNRKPIANHSIVYQTHSSKWKKREWNVQQWYKSYKKEPPKWDTMKVNFQMKMLRATQRFNRISYKTFRESNALLFQFMFRLPFYRQPFPLRAASFRFEYVLCLVPLTNRTFQTRWRNRNYLTFGYYFHFRMTF